jgi:hypothetical protein
MSGINKLLDAVQSYDQATQYLSDHQYLYHYIDALTTRPPQRTRAVLTAPFRAMGLQMGHASLLVVARFKTEYASIKEISRILTRSVLETGIVPIIRPIHVDTSPSARMSNAILRGGEFNADVRVESACRF